MCPRTLGSAACRVTPAVTPSQRQACPSLLKSQGAAGPRMPQAPACPRRTCRHRPLQDASGCWGPGKAREELGKPPSLAGGGGGGTADGVLPTWWGTQALQDERGEAAEGQGRSPGKTYKQTSQVLARGPGRLKPGAGNPGEELEEAGLLPPPAWLTEDGGGCHSRPTSSPKTSRGAGLDKGGN